MGKKNSGGKKFKSKKNGSSAPLKMSAAALAEITPDNENTFAAIVTKPCGDCRFIVRTAQSMEYKVALPGSLKKGPRLQISNMVFIDLSGILQGINGYILHIYNDHELQELGMTSIEATDDCGDPVGGIIFAEANAKDDEDEFDISTI